jgi:hypothetical protein
MFGPRGRNAPLKIPKQFADPLIEPVQGVYFAYVRFHLRVSFFGDHRRTYGRIGVFCAVCPRGRSFQRR